MIIAMELDNGKLVVHVGQHIHQLVAVQVAPIELAFPRNNTCPIEGTLVDPL
jgi:hypothetical protein